MHQARTARVPSNRKNRCRLAARPLACIVLLFASVAAVLPASASGAFITRDPDAEGGPTVELVTPAEAARGTAPTDVMGIVEGQDLAGWRLRYRPVDPNEFTTLNAGSGAITSGALGEFDPTQLINGQYRLVLEAWNEDGGLARAERTVRVAGAMKIGHFSMTYEDVTVPLAGMPVTLTRTYDSRQRGRAEAFGHRTRKHDSARISRSDLGTILVQ